MEKIETMNMDKIVSFLKTYDGTEMKLMEICGSHTAAISHNGIRSMLSKKIQLVSGPGCPVCVTPSAYIDKLIEIALKPHTCVTTFGDLLRVPGSKRSLNEARGDGAKVEMVYSPLDTLKLAEQNPDTEYVFAAVGFETTTPVYALLIEQAKKKNLSNIKILTSLKTMPQAVSFLMENGAGIDGFIAPGHVCAITGSAIFQPLAEKFKIPFAVSGFSAEELLIAIYTLAQMVIHNEYTVVNDYPSVVTEEGNQKAQALVNKIFLPEDASWRGMGNIPDSGCYLRKEYARYDAGSYGLTEDHKKNANCSCDQVLMGKIQPKMCPLFGHGCNPQNPQGACMVSMEGACYQYFVNQ